MSAKEEKMRVLMIGPGENVGGGISALVETILPELRRKVEVLYFPTVVNRSLMDCGKVTIKNLIIAGSQYIRYLYAMVLNRPNIIHLHTSQGYGWLKDTFYLWVSRLFGCRIVLHMHGGNFDNYYNESPRPIQLYTLGNLKLADLIVTVSHEWEDRIKKILPNGKVVSLLNCIDLDELRPKNDGNDQKDRVFAIFLGRVGPLKGAMDLIESLGILQSRDLILHTWILGGEEQNGDMKRAQTKIDELGLSGKCELLGNVGRDRKNQLLIESNVFILPSYYECLPISILEAMAAGLPIIATPVGGIPEVVKEGENGFLVLPGDINTLAERIERIVIDRKLRKVMGNKSREIAEQILDVNEYTCKLINLYRSL